KKKLDDIYEEIPEFNKLFRILLQNAFIAQQERIMSNISLSAEQKYLRLREKYPLFEKRIPLKQLALYLGITPQFLSMIRKKITKKGISSTS
ncbi:MAG: Crp/Fnr family transcriptional regulator, partial [Bacteroidota bacterium]